MDRFVYDNDFDKDVIYSKLADLSDKLEEERTKNKEEFSPERERELLYAQMIQGLKLNTMFPRRTQFY